MTTSYYLQVIFSLSLLAIVLYVIVKFANKWQKNRYSGDITIIDRKPIDTGSSLVIAKIRSQEYLLGLSGKTIHLLEKL